MSGLERKRAATTGGEMAYVDVGDGPSVVCLHGFPTNADLWRDLVPMLAPRFRAIAPDLLGYGGSEAPAGAEIHIRAQARAVRQLLGNLGVERFAVVGHDIGGGVGQLLALEGGVEGLVLLDSISFDSWPIEAVRMIQEVQDEQADAGFAENLVRTTFDIGMGRRERLADEDLALFLEPWRRDPLALVRAARGIDGIGLVGAEERLGALETRALIVWGEEDPFQPVEWAERLGDALPMASVAVLPGCGHFVMEDAPEAVLPLITQFLRRAVAGDEHGHDHGPQMFAPEDLGISLERPDA